MTTRFVLTDGAWTDLGAAPCTVQSLPMATGMPGKVRLSIGSVAPATPDADAHLLYGPRNFDADIGLTGNVWARAGDARGAVVAVSR